MSKFKLFIENFLIYGVGGVISKAVPLLMLPVITRLMPNPLYYGLADLSGTITSFGSAIAILGMYDAMFRYFFEKEDEEYKKDICSTTLIFTLGMSFVIFLLMLLLKEQIATFIFSDLQYGYLVYLTAVATFVGATNSIIAAPTRMQNKRKIFLVTNTLSPIIGYSVSIPLLLNGYYVIALPMAGVVSSLVMELAFWQMNRHWFSFRRFRLDYLQNLLKIAVPLAPTFLVYWVFNSCDRIMLADILGVQATGIYSVGAKLGMASQLIYTAFAGGWQYFAFSTMKDKNQVKSNSKVMEYLGIVSFAATLFICAISCWFYNCLFVGEYVAGYVVSPYLFLAPLLLMLYQVIANQFLVVKKTWPGVLCLSIGAMMNVGCNAWLIPQLGIEGAGMATLIGYFVSLVLVSIVLMRMKLLVISPRFYAAAVILVISCTVWRLLFRENLFGGLGIAVLGTIGIFACYCGEFYAIWKSRNRQRL